MKQTSTGSISIQCCADASFQDPNTNISYISDEFWHPDKKSCQWTGNANRESNEARFFESRYDSKWCYTLPTSKGSVYLVRGTFPLSDPQASPSDDFFSVSVGETEIERVDSARERVEGIFKATRNYTNFCLVIKGKGGAYLSKVELRPSHVEYLRGRDSSVLKLVDRVDVGNKDAEIRYIYIICFLNSISKVCIHALVLTVMRFQLSGTLRTCTTESGDETCTPIQRLTTHLRTPPMSMLIIQKTQCLHLKCYKQP